ncbi:hypothetical protein Tco_0886179 [Tanacetum coccineum]
MHTTIVPEQVKTMKIQAGIQVSRPGELKRQLQLWKCFGRLYSIVSVPVKNTVKDNSIAFCLIRSCVLLPAFWLCVFVLRFASAFLGRSGCDDRDEVNGAGGAVVVVDGMQLWMWWSLRRKDVAARDGTAGRLV